MKEPTDPNVAGIDGPDFVITDFCGGPKDGNPGMMLEDRFRDGISFRVRDGRGDGYETYSIQTRPDGTRFALYSGFQRKP